MAHERETDAAEVGTAAETADVPTRVRLRRAEGREVGELDAAHGLRRIAPRVPRALGARRGPLPLGLGREPLARPRAVRASLGPAALPG